MKRNIFYLLFVMLCLQTGVAFAMTLVIPAGEKVVLITDRSIYISGEKLHFFATVLNSVDSDKPIESQVLYCELITPDGNKIAGSKFLIKHSAAGGCIDIPVSQLTGTYYLRAYTKFMRKNGPETYAYSQIRIVNPEKVEILASDNDQNNPFAQISRIKTDTFPEIFDVSTDKTTYAARDTVSLSVQMKNTVLSDISNVCLFVIPENTTSNSLILKSLNNQPKDEPDYYPESRGLTVSGKLTEASSSAPLASKKVNLSIIGEGRDIMAVRTDSVGRFFFALPDYSGSRDLFVCAEKTASLDVKIWVDNDFCSTPFRLPSPAFTLTEKEMQSVYNMALNTQLSAGFYKDTLQKSQNVKSEEFSFYGKPEVVIFPDKYIQMPTLEEYFYELPSGVKIRKRKGDPYFTILGSRGLSFYDPLVMVDWVAIDDPAKILGISPFNISRIEIVTEDYVKGDQTYGGIINIISKKGDYAGIELPSTGIFINYQFLADTNCNDKLHDNLAEHPDTRNTILWKPGITIKQNSSEKFVFTTPDTPGRYSIVVEGISLKGELFSTTSTFEVTN